MKRALKLAARGKFTTSPNPAVGCVIVRNGMIIGEGYHIKQASRMPKLWQCAAPDLLLPELPAMLL